jgi:hypothetical protein
MRVPVCVYRDPVPTGAPLTRTDLNARELHGLRLVGLDVRVEHSDKVGGKVVDEWTDAKGGKHAVLEITSPLLQESLARKMPWEVSLCHSIGKSGHINPLEVSLCKTALRPGCCVVYEHPDAYKQRTLMNPDTGAPGEQQPPPPQQLQRAANGQFVRGGEPAKTGQLDPVKAKLDAIESALKRVAPHAVGDKDLLGALQSLLHDAISGTQQGAALREAQGKLAAAELQLQDLDKLTKNERAVMMTMLADTFASVGRKDQFGSRQGTFAKLLEVPGGISAMKEYGEVIAASGSLHRGTAETASPLQQMYDNSLRGLQRGAAPQASASDMEAFGANGMWGAIGPTYGSEGYKPPSFSNLLPIDPATFSNTSAIL